MLKNAVPFRVKLSRWRGSRSQKEAAYLLGIPYDTYNKYERGEREPHHTCCACCLERKMLLTAPSIPAAPVPLPSAYTFY